MRNLFLFAGIYLFLLAFTVNAQNEPSESVLLTISDEKFNTNEFMQVFNKNRMTDDALTSKELDDYLELFINYRLKVKEAHRLGYDTIRRLQKELAGYRKQLAEPYMMDEDINKSLMEEAFKRMQSDIRASHILIRVNPKSPPEDTLKAYNKIKEIRDKAIHGEPFDVLAREYSEDPSARDRQAKGRIVKGNGGDLGYFTAFHMIYPFETMAYQTPVGEISDIVRTRYGYHILKIHDKHEALGEVEIAHIMKFLNTAETHADSAAVKNEIYQLYDSLQTGVPFEVIAEKYSDDKSTSRKGGAFPVLRVNRMLPEFVETIYELEPGTYSKPVLTKYGWHIIKLLKREKVTSFDDQKAYIKKQLAKSDRAKIEESLQVKKILSEYPHQKYPENALALETVLSEDVFGMRWQADTAKQMTLPVFEIGDSILTQYDFAKYIEANQKGSAPYDYQLFLNDMFDRFTKAQTLAYEDSRLEEKYPEFAALMQEYQDGVLLFELTNDHVWKKAVEDTTGLKAYYEKHKAKYVWGKRVDVDIFSANQKFVVKKARKMARKGDSVDEIRKYFAADSSVRLEVESGLFEKGDNALIDDFNWKVHTGKIVPDNEKFVFIRINNLVPPEPKKFEEVRGLVTADYQNFLEKKWLKSLREKYDWKLNEDVFLQLKAQYCNE
jgi:peptidyl-prolyl cis-trans isomerase SurA